MGVLSPSSSANTGSRLSSVGMWRFRAIVARTLGRRRGCGADLRGQLMGNGCALGVDSGPQGQAVGPVGGDALQAARALVPSPEIQ